MAYKENREQGTYFNLMSDGKFHQVVQHTVEGAVLREGVTKDGTPYSKWEKIYQDISGIITKVDFYEGDYGKNLLLKIEDEGYEPVTVSVNVTSNFAEDIMKKLLNIDMSKPVKLVPYVIENKDTGKTKKGVAIYQGQDESGKFLKENENKIQSFFHEYDPETKTTTPKNGFPPLPKAKKGKTISSDEWKIYFSQCRLFMIEKIEEHFGIATQTSENVEAVNKAFDGE